MTQLQPSPPGYASAIHQGLLHQPTLWRAPHKLVIYNMMVCMLMCLWVSWRWVVIAAGIHIAAALVWAYDPHLLGILWRALRQPRRWEV